MGHDGAGDFFFSFILSRVSAFSSFSPIQTRISTQASVSSTFCIFTALTEIIKTRKFGKLAHETLRKIHELRKLCSRTYALFKK